MNIGTVVGSKGRRVECDLDGADVTLRELAQTMPGKYAPTEEQVTVPARSANALSALLQAASVRAAGKRVTKREGGRWG